ncbi:MAG: hypothetical protein ACXITV_01745 [Luteibaculaceae bacterium]
MRTKENEKTFVKKQAQLSEIALQLKKEFVGLSEVIDQLIRAVEGWYLMPALQQRPTVVNLWGLTGTGKTSLIIRFLELAQLQRDYIHFHSENNRELSGFVEHVSSYESRPKVLIFDEFQHYKTLHQTMPGFYKEQSVNSFLWEVLDSGFVNIDRYSFSYDIRKLFKLLNQFREDGANGQKGMFDKKFLTEFMREMGKSRLVYHINFDDPDDDYYKLKSIPFIPFNLYENLLDNNPKFATYKALKEYLFSLNLDETIQYLREYLAEITKPCRVDIRNYLIFIIGNLDEAFTMSKVNNIDINPDVFHKHSLEIKVPQIKEALETRFRTEQIARLGNTHIIYPAFSAQNFRDLIQLELEKIAHTQQEKTGVSLTFSASIVELIYSEGVYPTQGSRPVYSTLNNLITAKIPSVFTSALRCEKTVTRMVWRYENEFIVVDFYNQLDELVTQITHHQPLTLREIKVEPNTNKKAVVCVHEAAHAVVGMVLFSQVPVEIRVSGSAQGAFHTIFDQSNKSFYSVEEIRKEIAVKLAGYVAERLVFGADNVTCGSTGDLLRAENLLAELLLESGFFRLDNIFIKKLEKEKAGILKEIAAESEALAEKVLVENMDSLIALSKALLPVNTLKTEAILALIKANPSQLPVEELSTHAKQFSYLNALENFKLCSTLGVESAA